MKRRVMTVFVVLERLRGRVRAVSVHLTPQGARRAARMHKRELATYPYQRGGIKPLVLIRVCRLRP